MSDSNTQANVDAIIQELRSGMDDAAPLSASVSGASERRKLQGGLRKANASIDVLGRCGGSLRGRLCLQLARLALPVVEQLNAHHAAVVAVLSQLCDKEGQAPRTEEMADASVESRLAKLEAEVASLKAERLP
jgi:hypothetical protein